MGKTTISAAVLALGLIMGATPAYAIEETVDCVADPTNADCIVTTSDNDESIDLDTIVDPDEATGQPVPISNEEVTPINDEPDVIIEEEEIEEETEPALWPMYVSLGALGLAVLVFVVLNLCGPKRKK